MPPDRTGRKPDLAAFRFDTGRRCLDFVGTVGHRPAEHVERLTGPERLGDWLAEARLPPPTAAPDEGALVRAIELREALREVLDHTVEPPDPGPVSAAGLRTVNAHLAVPPPTPVLRRSATPGTPPLVAGHEGAVGVDALLGILARDAVDLLADDHLRGKLRRCEAGDCRKVFLDTAPRPRRWCSRQYCGTRSRVAAHRSRSTST